ncbi:L,D-transpeptidase [Halobacillus naozhouensis]|uniref:L,D-transpeptidase n=1 Tax=Halobacillus naozhouensis TaxID=554880 RepID=A0ABY8IVG1_9BACI|nr:L,D-transpeptidase [Halobacillus naozhouensis]WFT73193.1 L,D-transpeptidase [Halobacillus naozhouensis]
MQLIAIFVMMVTTFLPPATTGEPVIFVNKASNEITVYQSGKEIFHSKAATGKTKELTPEGHFTIRVKAKDPYYRKKDIPGGAPENPLGSRWIGFDANGTDGRIFGVHGTNRPESIGKSVSAGCIRLTNARVEQLYQLVEEGTEVIIVDDSSVSFDDMYKSWEKDKLAQFLK